MGRFGTVNKIDVRSREDATISQVTGRVCKLASGRVRGSEDPKPMLFRGTSYQFSTQLASLQHVLLGPIFGG